MSTKAKGTSVTQKLLALKDKAGVPFANISTAFLIERLVARLVADKELRKSLVFKLQAHAISWCGIFRILGVHPGFQ